MKGLYAKADRGEIPNFTGISSPYEPPVNAEMTLRSDRQSVAESVEKILGELKKRGIVQ